MSLVYQCQPTYAATMAGSPIPAGRSAPICTTGQGVWVDTSVAFATEYEAYIAQQRSWEKLDKDLKAACDDIREAIQKTVVK